MSELSELIKKASLFSQEISRPYYIVLVKNGIEVVGSFSADFIPTSSSCIEIGDRTFQVVGAPRLFPEIQRVMLTVTG